MKKGFAHRITLKVGRVLAREVLKGKISYKRIRKE